ncbi:MAG: hypothetical protein Q9212_006352 [Teloschistes hypoglaucus]
MPDRDGSGRPLGMRIGLQEVCNNVTSGKPGLTLADLQAVESTRGSCVCHALWWSAKILSSRPMNFGFTCQIEEPHGGVLGNNTPLSQQGNARVSRTASESLRTHVRIRLMPPSWEGCEASRVYSALISRPVIRIGVNELHVNSPNYFQEITKVGSRFYKEPNFYRGISYPSSSIGLIDPNAHRIRRQVLHPIFTASRVQTIAHKLQSKVEHLCKKFDESVSEDAPVNLYAAYKSLTMDIVSEMIFGESFHVMDSPGFQHPHLDALHDAVRKAWVFRTFPKLGWLSLNLPDLLSSTLFPIPIIELGKVCRKRIDQYLDNRSKPSQESRSEILEQLLDPNAARGHAIPNAYDLNEEALTLLTAGNDTTANAMIIGAYLICTHPLVLKRLVEELDTAFPAGEGSITFEKAKQLPYLTAVLREVLRCSNPLPGRLPRVVPPEGALVDGIDLAPGVIVHTSAYLLNRHRSVWGPDGRDFNPQRWLSGQHQGLEKHMTSFYRGARQCLGMQ